MKKTLIPSLVIVPFLLISTLACQVLGGKQSGNGTAPSGNTGSSENGSTELAPLETVSASEQPVTTQESSEFPLPPGAEKVTKLDENTVNFQVKMSLEEAISFYQDSFSKAGLTERTILHVESDTTFSMVFDGAENGMAIVVQGVDLGGGVTNINIRYEEV